ncbi:MAG: hypothetical protein IH585_09020 [Anaerolineaceae bacterium]|nr:hypothetical protein [Anaerolineaceae bacterium]
MKITQFAPTFIAQCSETHQILHSGHLVLHPAVTQVTLHGSRGLAGKFRPDSDIDLSLLISCTEPPEINNGFEKLCIEVLDVTLSQWKSEMELDLAVIFPLHTCNFACFQVNNYDPALCSLGYVDCFGIYKIQKGFSGFVLSAGIQVEKMYPLITVWKKKQG